MGNEGATKVVFYACDCGNVGIGRPREDAERGRTGCRHCNAKGRVIENDTDVATLYFDGCGDIRWRLRLVDGLDVKGFIARYPINVSADEREIIYALRDVTRPNTLMVMKSLHEMARSCFERPETMRKAPDDQKAGQ
jgi:hypothetical protein